MKLTLIALRDMPLEVKQQLLTDPHYAIELAEKNIPLQLFFTEKKAIDFILLYAKLSLDQFIQFPWTFLAEMISEHTRVITIKHLYKHPEKTLYLINHYQFTFNDFLKATLVERQFLFDQLLPLKYFAKHGVTKHDILLLAIAPTATQTLLLSYQAEFIALVRHQILSLPYWLVQPDLLQMEILEFSTPIIKLLATLPITRDDLFTLPPLVRRDFFTAAESVIILLQETNLKWQTLADLNAEKRRAILARPLKYVGFLQAGYFINDIEEAVLSSSATLSAEHTFFPSTTPQAPLEIQAKTSLNLLQYHLKQCWPDPQQRPQEIEQLQLLMNHQQKSAQQKVQEIILFAQEYNHPASKTFSLRFFTGSVQNKTCDMVHQICHAVTQALTAEHYDLEILASALQRTSTTLAPSAA